MWSSKYNGILPQKQKTAKKKNPKNAFSIFMDEKIPELRRQGHNVSFKGDAVPLCHAEWKSMTAEQKAPYEAKAKKWKNNKNANSNLGHSDNRLDNTGNLMRHRVNMDALKEEKIREQRKFIKEIWPSGKDIVNQNFFVISFQSLYEFPDEDGYLPCEIACVEYSMKEGIIGTYHSFIEPRDIKFGLAAEIKIFSERTHQFSREAIEEFYSDKEVDGFHDHYDIWEGLLKFINPRKGNESYRGFTMFPPIFTKVAEYKKTEFCLNWLSSQAGVANQLTKLFELEDMAAEMFANAGIMKPSISIIEGGFNSTMCDYEANTKCMYHDDLECVYCALLIVNKCCYWFSDSLSDIYGFERTERHLPKKTPVAFVKTTPEDMIFDNRYRRPDHGHLSSEASRIAALSLNEQQGADDEFGGRDIRYKPNYHVAPSHNFSPFKDDITTATTAATSSNNVDEWPALSAGDPSAAPSSNGTSVDPLPHASSNEGPSEIRHSRRPKSKPAYGSKQLAANFPSVPPPSSEKVTNGNPFSQVVPPNKKGGKKAEEAEKKKDEPPQYDPAEERDEEQERFNERKKLIGLGRGKMLRRK